MSSPCLPGMLWYAPEHLRTDMPLKGSQKGDVYSFAIILEEIIVRGGPYEHYRSEFSPKGE